MAEKCSSPSVPLLSVIATCFCVVVFAASGVLGTDIPGPTPTPWGDFGNWGMCDPGFAVVGLRLATEDPQGAGDDTGLNDVELLCRQRWGKNTEVVEVPRAHGKAPGFGTWKDAFGCSSNRDAVAIGIELKIEGKQNGGDDTGANNINLFCSNGEKVDGNGSKWGKWREPMMCPNFGLDDTAVNTVDIRCC
ncbi:unnamed protein product [Notodromas monacha]|uniref:Vitelline membrane outer layer protein 1 homolog n=1 Tax=Notodromas monacha TaxID=399045 RepID=A0A7R9BVM0_9CRUS|nr:unnamed protein product [Notodromas monacha]CAG0920946.1 unnamed protein product [Notodromas monacha]